MIIKSANVFFKIIKANIGKNNQLVRSQNNNVFGSNKAGSHQHAKRRQVAFEVERQSQRGQDTHCSTHNQRRGDRGGTGRAA